MKKIFLILLLFIIIFLTGCELPTKDNNKHTHKASLWQYDDDYHYHLCEECNVIYDKAKHNYSSYEIIQEATADNDGIMSFTCLTCGYNYKITYSADKHIHSYGTNLLYDNDYHWYEVLCGHDEAANKQKHQFDNGAITIAPTETTEGLKTYSCLYCNYQKTEKLPKLTHNHTYSDTLSYDSDYHWYPSTCGHDDSVTKESHTFDEGKITKEPTLTDTGIKTYTCTQCGYKKTEILQKATHTHTSNKDYSYNSLQHYYTCVECGEFYNANEHTFGEWNIITEATDLYNGYKTRTCSICGYVDEAIIPQSTHTHTYASSWSSDETYHWYAATCSHDVVSAKDYHEFSNWIIDNPATTTSTGLQSRTCTVCGYKQEEVIAKLSTSTTYNKIYSANFIPSGSYYNTGNYKAVGDFELYRFNYSSNYLAILLGYPNGYTSGVVEELPSAIYNIKNLGDISALYIRYRSNSNAYIAYSEDRTYQNTYELSASSSFTTVEISLNDCNYFKVYATDSDLIIDEIKLATKSGYAQSTTITYDGYRANPEVYDFDNIPSGTKRTASTKVSYQDDSYTIITSKEYIYYNRSEAYSYINNTGKLGKYADGVYTDPVDVANYYLLFHDFPINYLSRRDAYDYIDYFGDDIRCVSEYSRTNGYVNAIPYYYGYNFVYYELDLAINSSYGPGARGVGRLVVFDNGFSATGYDSSPVIVFTDDHYATFAEYNNLGEFLTRFDAEKTYTATKWNNVKTYD